jgi:hypothetical protein
VDNYFDSASTQFFDDSTSEMSSNDGLVPPWNPLVYHVGHTSADHDFFWENLAAWQETLQDGEYSTDDDMPDLLVIRISKLIDVVLTQEGQAIEGALFEL